MAFRPVVVYDGACWKGRMVANVWPSVAKTDLKKAKKNPVEGQESVRNPPQ